MEGLINYISGECGVVVSVLLLVIIAMAVSIHYITNKYVDIVESNNKLINRLVERINEHE